MIKFVEKSVKIENFEPGTLIYDSASKLKTVVLIVEPICSIGKDTFAGVYLKSMRYSEGFSKLYPDWELYQGKAVIENEENK